MSDTRRILLAPRMLLLHVLVLAVVLGLAWLGTWQLSRHAEAQERVAGQEERLAATPVPVGELLDGLTTADGDELAALEFRSVTARGTWRPADEVLQRGRAHRGGAGYEVLTPLDLDDGSTVLVRRGSVPLDNDLVPPVPDARPAAGPVTVQGTVERSIPQPTGGVAQRDPDEGELDVIFNADLDRLGPQLVDDVDTLLPMVLRLEVVTPDGPDELPDPVDPPVPDLGPHLNYAIQWFSFTAIAIGMYALWLYRRVRGDERAVAR